MIANDFYFYKIMPISKHLQNLRAKVGNEILQLPSVAAIIRDNEKKILLVKNAENGIWGLIGGAIDLGETPAEAVVREVYEESGLNIEPQNIVGVFGGKNFRYIYPNGDQVEYLIVVFNCEVISGKLSAQDGEISEFRYFPVEEMPDPVIPYPKEIFLNFDERKTCFE